MSSRPLWDLDFPVNKHAVACAVWHTHDQPCTCGADAEEHDPRNLLLPLPGSTAARLDALDVRSVELDCDGDPIGGDAA